LYVLNGFIIELPFRLGNFWKLDRDHDKLRNCSQ
jgi:hypothetical protein